MASNASPEVVVLARAWEFESPPSYLTITESKIYF
jgi:hypothetical protein